MKMINNLILDSEGFKPVASECLKPVCGISWYNFINVKQWKKNGKTYTTKEALAEVEKLNKETI